MRNQFVPKHDSAPTKVARYTRTECVVLASGACVMSLWFGALAWGGYKIVTLII